MTTRLYVDGFNTYYGLLQIGARSPYGVLKWLDLAAAATAVWPHLSPIALTRYFTAPVISPPSDPQLALRQQVYLRALSARGVQVHFGQMKMRRKTMRMRGAAASMNCAERIVTSAEVSIAKYDEKGSDVNLASYLVRDAAMKLCTHAIVMSNDSDLAESIRVARVDFGAATYVVNPQGRQPVAELAAAADGVRTLRAAAVRHSLLPSVMADANGSFYKPPAW